MERGDRLKPVFTIEQLQEPLLAVNCPNRGSGFHRPVPCIMTRLLGNGAAATPWIGLCLAGVLSLAVLALRRRIRPEAPPVDRSARPRPTNPAG